jgi:hypothetical protein
MALSHKSWPNVQPFSFMRPENKRMQAFLKDHGIIAGVKYLPDGSLRGCWSVYGREQPWTDELCARLGALGFRGFDGDMLNRYSGNGGAFSVFLRGHNELLNP